MVFDLDLLTGPLREDFIEEHLTVLTIYRRLYLSTQNEKEAVDMIFDLKFHPFEQKTRQAQVLEQLMF